jgi:hypothetical protein
MNVADSPKESLIPSRVMLIGEGQIPGEVLEALEDRLLKIFMREPDPEEWPSEMRHLVQYLSEDEQTKHSVSKILRRHDSLLGQSLETWAVTAWEELVQTEVINPNDRQMIVEEMAKHVKAQLGRILGGV